MLIGNSVVHAVMRCEDPSVSFFSISQPDPPPRRVPQRSPSWMGPPDNWAPGIAPMSVIVGHSEEVAAVVSRIAAFPAGFEFDITTSLRYAPNPYGRHPRMLHGPDAILVGLEYANGARAPQGPAPRAGVDNSELRLFPKGGHGGGTTFRGTFWASPLPPPGPVTFAVAWPAIGLAESTVSIEGAVILEAAEGAVQLWPEEPDAFPEADFSNAPALPPGGTPPADEKGCEAAVRKAFAQVFDNGPQSPTDPLAAVQDGSVFAGALEQVRAQFPVEATSVRAAVGAVVFLDEVRAGVQFQLLRAEGFSPGPQLGYAVLEGGTWKVARDTYARVLGMAGVAIPPPPPPAL